jgi:hypothetical protein
MKNENNNAFLTRGKKKKTFPCIHTERKRETVYICVILREMWALWGQGMLASGMYAVCAQSTLCQCLSRYLSFQPRIGMCRKKHGDTPPTRVHAPRARSRNARPRRQDAMRGPSSHDPKLVFCIDPPAKVREAELWGHGGQRPAGACSRS